MVRFPDRHGDQPWQERWPKDEIDFTGVVEQMELLRSTCRHLTQVAAAQGSEVSSDGARVIARFLATMQPELSTLNRFAITGTCRPLDLFEDVGGIRAELWSGESGQWIDALTTWITGMVSLEEQAKKPHAHDVDVLRRIDEFGTAYAAFLTLPDVTPETPLEQFHDTYVSSYPSMKQVYDYVVSSLDLEARLKGAGVDDFASIDQDKVFARARDAFDIVKLNHHIYLFWK